MPKAKSSADIYDTADSGYGHGRADRWYHVCFDNGTEQDYGFGFGYSEYELASNGTGEDEGSGQPSKIRCT